MRVLLDESVPVQVRGALPGHDVATVSGLGWKGRENVDLLGLAEHDGFNVFVLADKNLRYQQNLDGRRLAIVELWTNHRPTLENNFPRIAEAVRNAGSGQYVIVPAP